MTTSPARARTDAAATPTQPGRVSERTIRRLGLGLTTGTLIWAASIFTWTPDPKGTEGRIGDLAGLAFQLGVFCLLTIQIKTRATGKSTVLLKVEAVILGLASIWSLLHGVLPTNLQGAVWLAFLDICWPLSMLGMAVIAVKLALTARWRGALRWWPLVAESWAIVTVPTSVFLGDGPATWVGGTHLLMGYATLGVLLALRPKLVLPQH